jgi:hypothetical protein
VRCFPFSILSKILRFIVQDIRAVFSLYIYSLFSYSPYTTKFFGVSYDEFVFKQSERFTCSRFNAYNVRIIYSPIVCLLSLFSVYN